MPPFLLSPKNKKLFFSFLLLLIISCNILPIPTVGQAGVYNIITGMIWCKTKSACIHEIGHKVDHEAGWISSSEDFSRSLIEFVLIELREKENPHPFVYKILNHPGVLKGSPSLFSFDNAELYASLLEWSGGVSENMPEALRPFYDWDRISELLEKHKR